MITYDHGQPNDAASAVQEFSGTESKILYVPEGMEAIADGRTFTAGYWVVGKSVAEDRRIL